MRLSDRIVLIFATGLGVGWMRPGPGTFGSLWGVLLAWGLSVGGITGAWLWCALAVLAIVCIPICGRAATLLARKDPGPVVLDEVVGMSVALGLVPFSWPAAAVGFLLFRILDVWKPWPLRQLERLPGGMGVMADDLAAGALAAAILWIGTPR
jgi:phosphatidylglycerophosphatase A